MNQKVERKSEQVLLHFCFFSNNKIHTPLWVWFWRDKKMAAKKLLPDVISFSVSRLWHLPVSLYSRLINRTYLCALVMTLRLTRLRICRHFSILEYFWMMRENKLLLRSNNFEVFCYQVISLSLITSQTLPPQLFIFYEINSDE